jgi:type I site-specific restriction endonuclease
MMNQDEIKTMMRSFERLNSKPNKSAQNTMTLDDMWHKMPQIVQHQITAIEEYQEAYQQQAERIERLEDLLWQVIGKPDAPIGSKYYGYALTFHEGGLLCLMKTIYDELNKKG